MKKESNYHDASTGKFVTAEYAKENPDTTVEVSEHNLKMILTKFLEHTIQNLDAEPFPNEDIQEDFIINYIKTLKQ